MIIPTTNDQIKESKNDSVEKIDIIHITGRLQYLLIHQAGKKETTANQCIKITLPSKNNSYNALLVMIKTNR